jgi:hypothetical protein
MSKDQSKAREKIQELVQKFRREQAAGVIGQYNESETNLVKRESPEILKEGSVCGSHGKNMKSPVRIIRKTGRF